MLQLACILNMVSVWKRATVRVFLCTDSQDTTENLRRKSRLDDLLNQLRITASTQLVQIENVKNLLNRPIISESDLQHYQVPYTNLDILNVSDIYIKAVNQLIRQYSDSSSLCFLYLPPPAPLYKQQRLTANQNSSSNLGNSSMNDMSAMSNDSRNPFDTSGGQQQNNSSTTAFISTSHDITNENNQKYMRILETISDSLPPCMFVNGVSCVTSTHL
jgi:hypothetical protein